VGVVKRYRVCRVDSPDGEIHLVLEEPTDSENSKCLVDVSEVKEISRKEAAKSLVLFREE